MRVLWLVAGAVLIGGCDGDDKDDVDGELSAVSSEDADNDGFSEANGDCDDADSTVHPNARESCNGEDDDCDGVVDENAKDALDWFDDEDGDGFGTGSSTEACAAPDGMIDNDDDCDDADADVNPDAAELCDGMDNDCDDDVDDDDDDIDPANQLDWFTDDDGDGFGSGAAVVACQGPNGTVISGDDCDDADGNTFPGAAELCDGSDNDCDGLLDEDVQVLTWYFDGDSDGWGDEDDTQLDCDQPVGYARDPGDCNDDDDGIHPGAFEIVGDGIDADCTGTEVCFADSDADDWRDIAGTVESSDLDCDDLGEAPNDAPVDCDDDDDTVYPGAPELCDAQDNDCDLQVDEELTPWFLDSDDDGFGDPGNVVFDCAQPADRVTDNTDCDDGDDAIHPDAVEVCNGFDDNCDNDIDGDDAWWNGAWPYRIPITVKGAAFAVPGAPVAAKVDFAEALADMGVSAPFDPDSVRVVQQSCDGGAPVELASQFADGVHWIFQKKTTLGPEGDGVGVVAFTYDEDGDPSTLETPPFSGAQLGIYFGTVANQLPAPSYATDLVVTPDELSNDRSMALFDASQGGLLSDLTIDGSPSLASQADACCGNGVYTDSWGYDPMDGPGDLEVVADGAVLGAVRASGVRSTPSGDYEYEYVYLRFAGRPELFVKTTQVALTELTAGHFGDFTTGLRPWESRQDELVQGGTFTVSTALGYADTSNGTWGLGWGYLAPPKHDIDITNGNPYIVAYGNDFAPAGTGSPGILPAGEAFFDDVSMVVVPHAGTFADVSQTLWGLQDATTVVQDGAEGQ